MSTSLPTDNLTILPQTASINERNVSDAVIHDPIANENARANLSHAFTIDQSNALATKIKKLYEDGHYEVEAKITLFNALFKENFPDEMYSLIKPGTTWRQLTIDQKVAFGIYLASLGQVQVI
ncbi:hypothetical protein FIE12Z_12477 [Fusarium flagelliforme]|uniref:Uncharacterized protein n=1 Tax=Fusarium flagelliforme TaxID=2675880 RepID=A0A395M602_9HYPO|nr:hypothetical protein FIE12Z_12477 [Fusarium flagelliforme]